MCRKKSAKEMHEWYDNTVDGESELWKTIMEEAWEGEIIGVIIKKFTELGWSKLTMNWEKMKVTVQYWHTSMDN